MTREKKDPEYLHVKLGPELFRDLERLRGPRSWKAWLESIRDDFRKAKEAETDLRHRVEFLERQLERR